MENSMEDPLKNKKIVVSFDTAILLLGIYPKKKKTLTKRYLHSHIHSGIIYNSQDMEATQVFTHG